MIIVSLGAYSACVGKGSEPQVLLGIWDSSAPTARQQTSDSKHLTHTPRLWYPRACPCLGQSTSSSWGEENFAGAEFQLRGATTEPCVCLHFVENKNFMNCSKPQTELGIRVKRPSCFQIPSFLKAAYFK